MKYCSDCGSPTRLRIPEDDNRERHVCESCDLIHYSNPNVIAGCLPLWGDQVLLCRRAIEPRKGYWTLPAGFLENGESVAAGAARETWEEAEAKIDTAQLYTVFSLPYISQIHMFYRANIIDGQFAAGPESLEVALFDEENIPWDELAFPVVTDTLKHYFTDRKTGDFGVHEAEIDVKRRLRKN